MPSSLGSIAVGGEICSCSNRIEIAAGSTVTLPPTVGLATSEVPDNCHAARIPAISVTSSSTASVSAVRSKAMRAAVASSSRAGAPPPASTVMLVSTSVAVTDPLGVDRDDGARGQGGRAPRDLIGEAQRRVELDGLAAADSARRQRQTGHAVTQLVGVLAPVDVAVDDADALDREVRGCCRAGFCRCGGRRRARRVDEVLPVAA